MSRNNNAPQTHSLEARLHHIFQRLEVARDLRCVSIVQDDYDADQAADEQLETAISLLRALKDDLPFPLSEWKSEPVAEWLSEQAEKSAAREGAR